VTVEDWLKKKDSMRPRASECLTIVEIRIALWPGLLFLRKLFHTRNHFHEISFSLALSRCKSQLAQGKILEKRETRARFIRNEVAYV